MNPIDDQLDRLFRAAARVPAGPAGPVPYGLETRVLAAWRATRSSHGGLWDVASFVRGLVLASVIMAASFLPALSSEAASSPFAEFLQLTDTTVSSDDVP